MPCLGAQRARSAAETRSGATAGTRVWMRVTLTWGMAASWSHARQTPRREDQRIAAGQDHFPDLRRARGYNRAPPPVRAATALPARPDHLAAETETAIYRAGIDELEQHAVGIAVDDAFKRAVGAVADRIAALSRFAVQFGASGTNCRAIGSPGSAISIRPGDRRRDGDGVTRRDILQRQSGAIRPACASSKSCKFFLPTVGLSAGRAQGGFRWTQSGQTRPQSAKHAHQAPLCSMRHCLWQASPALLRKCRSGAR